MTPSHSDAVYRPTGDKARTNDLTISHVLAERTLAELAAAVPGEEGDGHQMERMPGWTATYLAAWGSKRPDGEAMTVAWAARLAGVSTARIRQCRRDKPAFRRLEQIARYGSANWAQTFIAAGLRGLAPAVMAALADLVADRHPQTVLRVAEWAGGLASRVDLGVSGALAQFRPAELEQAAAELAEWQQRMESEPAGEPGDGAAE